MNIPDDEPVELTVEQAIAMLPDKQYIHAFYSARFLMTGADYPRERMIEIIKNAKARELSGPKATAMKHGLAIDDGKDLGCGWLFIETR